MRVSKAVLHSRAHVLSAGMHEAGRRCMELLETTATALNDGVVAVMLLAVQRGNLELCINVSVTRLVS